MNKIRWGILSSAGIAQRELIPAFQRAKNAEVVAIASESGKDRAQKVADHFNIKTVYDSYEKLLQDPDIDAVYIPLPNFLHKKWVIEAAKLGKHILCEKPVALNRNEFTEMKEACQRAGVLLMEAFMYYFHPQHERVREIMDSGEIGSVRYMQAGFTFLLPDEKRNESIKMSEEKGGGSIYDVGCYAIHAIRNILREEPDTVQVDAVIDEQYQIDTDSVGYLTFPSGARATFDSSFNLEMRNEYRLFGTKGKITVPRAFRPDQHGGEGKIIVETSDGIRIETLNGDQYCLQVEHISEAIIEGKQDLHHRLENTYKNMNVIDACYESIRSGKKVSLT
ncbi:Gfo/Idh/MocA family oxidoreductase [Pseudogracilibacillus sp. SE30717A]|uniref:Gfo/Idh/MocA family protein n=1 Tax=Pseudogracilibacillus sp. SE30717A TaxID=3098293 RepID=UPI00300E6430